MLILLGSRPRCRFKRPREKDSCPRERVQAAQENHEQLTPVFDWFRQTLHVLSADRSNHTIIHEYLRTGFEVKKPSLLQFLHNADIGIVDLRLMRERDDGHQLQSIHLMRGSKQKVVFAFDAQESDGTRAMLALATFLTQAAHCPQVLFIDEIDKSLHPLLLKALFKAFHSLKMPSQLVFTLLDAQQMDEELFRKDQIWLMEKDHEKRASVLYSLADLKGIRKEHAFDRRYLSGAYGALPFLGKFDLGHKR